MTEKITQIEVALMQADEVVRHYAVIMNDGWEIQIPFNQVFDYCQRHHPLRGIPKPNGPCWHCVERVAKLEWVGANLATELSKQIFKGDDE